MFTALRHGASLSGHQPLGRRHVTILATHRSGYATCTVAAEPGVTAARERLNVHCTTVICAWCISISVALQPSGALASGAPAPQVGSCLECMGEVDGTLNLCKLESVSCVSVSNDDEAHFAGPWEYDGSREQAVAHLLDVATGGAYQGRTEVSRGDVAQYAAADLVSTLTGGPRPDRPGRTATEETPAFNGTLADRHMSRDGSEYLRFVFFPTQPSGSLEVGALSPIDAEFLLPQNDNIVNVRASSREAPRLGQGRLELSFQYGIEFDSNQARRSMEALRKALGWQLAPVISDFDPRFNDQTQLWFEKLIEPFKGAQEAATRAIGGDVNNSVPVQ